MMGFKKRGVGLLTAAAMLISALAPGMAFADDEALELAAEKAVLDENFTETSMDQTALEALGWTENGEYSQADSGTQHSPANGTFSAEAGTLTMTKTSASASENNTGGKTVYTVEKPFDYVQESFGGDERVTLRQSNLKGKYEIELKGMTPDSSGQSTWIDVYGWRDAGVQTSGVGRLRLHQNKSMYVYNNKLNSGSGDGALLWKNANTKSDIKLVFDSAASTFQVFKDNQIQSVLEGLNSGASADTFAMTSWGDAAKVEENGGVAKGAYICGLAFSAPKQMAANFDYIAMEGLKVTEIERMADAADTEADKITVASLTAAPAAVTGDLTLPESTDSSVTVTWTSSNPDVITDGGAVVRPALGEPDADVIMTAEIVNTENLFTLYKDFRLTVAAEKAPAGPVVLIDEDYATGKTEAELADMGWSEDGGFAVLQTDASPANGNFASKNGKLVLTKTSETDTSASGKGKLAYVAEKQLNAKQENYGGDPRVTLRQSNFKGKYALELKNLALKQAGNSMWTDLIGWRNTAKGQNDSVGRGNGKSSKIFSIYNNALNIANTKELDLWPSTDTPANISFEIDSASSTFQVKKNDEVLSITGTLLAGAKADTFTMTNWGTYHADPSNNNGVAAGAYLRGIAFEANRGVTKDTGFVELEGIKLTEIERMEDPADTAAGAISMTDLTADPENVTAAITLPESAEPDVTVTWSSSDPSVISNDGSIVTRPADLDAEVVMTAEIVNTANMFTLYKDFRLTVPADSSVPDERQEILDRAKADLTMVQLTDTPRAVVSDLKKPLVSSWTDTGNSGKVVSISWKSNNTAVIADDGTLVKRDGEDYYVVMTATLTVEGKSDTKSFGLTVPALLEEGVVISETFAGKTVKDNTLPNWEYMESAAGTGTNTINSKGNLVLTKNEAAAATHGEYPKNKYTLTQVGEAYNETTRAETMKQAFRGKYKLELKIIPHITQQLIPVSFWGGEPGNEKSAFSMCVRNNLIDIYVSSGNYETVAKDLKLDGKETTIAFDIDTNTNKVPISVNGAAPYEFDASSMVGGSSYFLQAVSVGLKESSAKNDSVEVVSVKLYEQENYIKNEAEIQAAMEQVQATDLTPEPGNVTGNLTLPAEQNGVAITWKSGDTALIRSDGTLVEQPFDADRDVTMSAVFQKDGAVWTKTYRLTVKKLDDPQVILKAAADALDYSDLISGSKDELNENIKTPATGLYGTTITWTSSAPEYISNSGQILKHDDTVKKEVSMTATFHYGGQTYEKVFTFRLTVPFSGDYTFFETDFSGTALPEYAVPFGVGGNGSIEMKDSKLYLHRTNAGTSTDGPGVKIYPTLDGKRFTIGEECVIYADLLEPEDCKKIEMVFYGSNGSRITSLYTGVDKSKGKGYTAVGRTALDASDATHKRVDVGTNEMPLHVECRVNFATKAMTLTVNGQTQGELKFIREDATDFAYIEIKNIYDTNNKNTNTGTAVVNNAGVRVTKAMVPEIIMNQVDYFGAVNSLNGYVTKDIPLVDTAYGNTAVTWTSSNPEVLTHEGKLRRDAFTEDTALTLTFKLAMKDNPEIYAVREFPLTALYMDPDNLAYDKTAESSVYSLTGHGANMAVDGNFGTSWQTLRADDTPALTVDLGKNTVINRVDLHEAEIMDRYAVKAFVIEVSTDNKHWTQAAKGESLGAEVKTVTFSPVIGRYVRYRVTDKESGNTGLNEIQVFLKGGEKTRAEADLILLKEKLGDLTGLTSSVTLPLSGEYGSTFTYSSSIPEYFSDSGAVKRGKETQYGTLRITATLNGESAEDSKRISVLGTGGSGGGGTPSGGSGGSGGGSGSSSGGFNTGNVAYPEDGNQTTVEGSFRDVSKSHWAYHDIEALKAKDIVSGDDTGLFRPEDNTSREEFLKMLLGALGIRENQASTASFADVDSNDWCYPYIAAAVEAGIVNGISDTEFGKGRPVTREDMAVLCMRALNYVGKTLTEVSEAKNFTDADSIADYAQESVTAMQIYGVINGYEDGSFAPKNNAVRAEAAKIINRISE